MILGPLDLSGSEVQGDPVIGMPLTLAGARQVAAQVHRDRALGRDPVAEHKARKHRHQAAAADRAAGSFAVAARAFVEEHAKVNTRRWQQTARTLGLHPDGLEPISGGLAQRWADRAARSIDGHDVYQVIDEARRVGIPGIPVRNGGASEARALALCAALSTAFGWMHRRRLVDANPCSGIHRPSQPRARDRVLTSDEIRRFWHATETLVDPFGAALRLLLLTGCRLNEIANLRWDEISDDCAEIRLPGSRTKNHRAHIVPLAPLARDTIASLPRLDGCQYAFSTNGRTAISGWSKTKTRLDAMMDVPAWRFHDLRRTAVTGMAELNIAPHVIELVVNHVSGSRGGVAGIYNRSEMMQERRAALERWAAHVDGLVAGRPSNVTSLPRRM
jgi:integrase